jgi:putative hydrolase of the HAD superfamily
MQERLRTVFFDAGDTLIRIRSPLYELYTEVINREKNNGFQEDTVRAAMREIGERFPLMLDGHFRYSDGWFEKYIFKLLEAIECPEPWNAIRQGLFDLFDDPTSFVVFPDVIPCLKAIRDMGLQTAVISNWGYRLTQLLEKLLPEAGFEIVISSAEVEREKPDPGIFELALTQVRSQAHEAIHIGDSIENDVDGARLAEVGSLLLDRGGQHLEIEARIPSLDALPPYIERLYRM